MTRDAGRAILGRRSPAALALVAACTAALAGCAAARKTLVLAPDFAQKCPQRVAVLLFENDSLDLKAPPLLRKLALDRVAGHGYAAPTLEETDSKLRDLGFTDGGQLRGAKPQDLAEKLGVDGLLYGDIESFTFTDIGYAMRKLVKVRLTLVAASDGEKLWEDEKQAIDFKIRTNQKEAEKGAAVSLAEKAVGNMLQRPLYPQSVEVMDKLFATLPRR